MRSLPARKGVPTGAGLPACRRACTHRQHSLGLKTAGLQYWASKADTAASADTPALA
jgi:hypothetical protein